MGDPGNRMLPWLKRAAVADHGAAVEPAMDMPPIAVLDYSAA